MAKDDDVLYALIGAEENKETLTGGGSDYGGWPWNVWRGYDFQTPENNFMFGRTICAFDINSGNLLWHKNETDYIDGRAVVMNKSNIFYYVFGEKMVAVNKSNGSNVWVKSDTNTLNAIGEDLLTQAASHGFATYSFLKCNDDFLVFSGPQRPYIFAMSADDGSLLWKRKNGNYHVILRDDILHALGPKRSYIEIHWVKVGDSYERANYTPEELEALRLAESEGLILAPDGTALSLKINCNNGNILDTFPPRAQCTRATASTESIFYRAWNGTAVFDFDTESRTQIAPMRPPCQDGIIIADGMLHWGTWTCHCDISLYGNINLVNATINIENGLVFQSGNLNVIQNGVVKTVVKEYGCSNYDVPESNLTKKWSTNLSALPLTPAVVAEGFAYCGDEAGVLHAVDAETGTEIWKAFTDAAIFSAPAYWNGRVFAASADGNLYAFDAVDGRLLWKYQLAPAKRLINVYDKIISTWPLSGGVVVKDGIVYAAAGIANYDGTYVCALNAQSGDEEWVNKTSGTLSAQFKNGVSLQGFLYIENNELRFDGGNIYPVARYNLSTGACLNSPLNSVARGSKASVFSAYYDEYNPCISFDNSVSNNVAIQYNGLREGRAKRSRFGLYNVADPANPVAIWSLNYAIRSAANNNDNILVIKDDSDTSAITLLEIQNGNIVWKDLLPDYVSKYGLAETDNNDVILSLQNGELICYGSDSMVAYWRFENGSNGFAHNADNDDWYADISDNKSDMSTLSSVSRPIATASVPFPIIPLTGQTNNLALIFDGANDYLSTSGNKWIDNYNFVDGWTIEANVMFNSLDESAIICKEGNLGTEGFPFFNLLLDSNTKKFRVITARTGDEAFRIINGTTIIQTGKWYSIAVTYDRNNTGTDREVELFYQRGN